MIWNAAKEIEELAERMKPLAPEYAELLSKHFWELLM